MNGRPDDSPMASARTQNPDAFCPACERYIGPADECPYCETDSRRGAEWQRLRQVALLLAVAGLACLFLAAARREPTGVRIAGITPMMNFAAVKVSGTVERDARVSTGSEGDGYVSFVVQDGTGKLRVTAYDAVARELEAGGRIPRRGARVEAAGYLNVSADGNVRLILRHAEGLNVTSAAPEAADGSVSNTAAGHRRRR